MRRQVTKTAAPERFPADRKNLQSLNTIAEQILKHLPTLVCEATRSCVCNSDGAAITSVRNPPAAPYLQTISLIYETFTGSYHEACTVEVDTFNSFFIVKLIYGNFRHLSVRSATSDTPAVWPHQSNNTSRKVMYRCHERTRGIFVSLLMWRPEMVFCFAGFSRLSRTRKATWSSVLRVGLNGALI